MRARGRSITEIAPLLKVSKASVFGWTKDVSISSEGRKRLAKRRMLAWQKGQESIQRLTKLKEETARLLAMETVNKLNLGLNEARAMCALMYACEGSKSLKDPIQFTNSDPLVISTFVHLFRQGFVLDPKKFRAIVHVHAYHNEMTQRIFWSKVTGIPLQQFYRSYQKSNSGKNIKAGYQGCVQVRYLDVKIGRIIRALAREFYVRKIKKGP